MTLAWKWKAWLTVGLALLSVYCLIPSILQLPARRAALEEAGATPPGYFRFLSHKALTLGLDLQGGIYVELQVEIEQALRRKLDILGNQLIRDLKEEGVQGAETSQPEVGQLVVRLTTVNERAPLDRLLRGRYRDLFTAGATATAEGRPLVPLTVTDEYRKTFAGQVLSQALTSVRNRIDRYGVGEPDIRLQGHDRIAIEIPGSKDPERALRIIKRTGQLEFRLVSEAVKPADLAQRIADTRKANTIPEDDYTIDTTRRLNELLQPQLPADTEIVYQLERDRETHQIRKALPYLVTAKAEVTGDMLAGASVDFNQQNDPIVLFSLQPEGATRFGELTKTNVGKPLAILLDGTLMSAPVIQEAILGGHGQITLGRGTFQTLQREAEDLALVLQEGALPANLTEATKTVVGPSLGADLIRQGMRAMALAALVVVVFMAIYYRLSGILADLAVALNIVMILGALALFGATLTLPGIAGIVLTIGMAVDANIVINERIREELRAGKSVRSAIETGYANASRAVIDANVTTLIAGIVLYQFGTGPIRGFAVTLSIGILTTLFTAVVVTRVVYDYVVQRFNPQRLSI